MKIKIQLVVPLFLALAAVANGAMVTLNFTSSLLYAQPGQQVTFSGTLTNIGATTAFLNGDSFNFPLPADDTPFLLGAPLSLLPGASFTGPMLHVSVPPVTPVGLYTGSFSVLGGDTPTSQNVLATEVLAVQVVPEPATWHLAMLGVLGVLCRRTRKV